MADRRHLITRIESFSDAVFAFALMGPLHTWNGMMEGKAQRALHAPVPSRHA